VAIWLINTSSRGLPRQTGPTHGACLPALMEAQMQEKDAEPTPTGLDPEKGLEQPLVLLRTKDDTYRFVGLALLKSVLDNQQSLREDPRIIAKCWAAISPKFLDALLRASESGGRSQKEAQNMVGLAVAVIHAFLVLLPSESCENVSMVGRTPGLVAALLRR